MESPLTLAAFMMVLASSKRLGISLIPITTAKLRMYGTPILKSPLLMKFVRPSRRALGAVEIARSSPLPAATSILRLWKAP